MAQGPDGVVRDQVGVPERHGTESVWIFRQQRIKQIRFFIYLFFLLVILLGDVETIGQASQEGFHDDVIHSQPCLQTPTGDNCHHLRVFM